MEPIEFKRTSAFQITGYQYSMPVVGLDLSNNIWSINEWFIKWPSTQHYLVVQEKVRELNGKKL